MWEVSPRTLSSYCIPWRACCASGTHFTHVFSQGLLPGRQADSGQHPQWMLTNGGGLGRRSKGEGRGLRGGKAHGEQGSLQWQRRFQKMIRSTPGALGRKTERRKGTGKRVHVLTSETRTGPSAMLFFPG